jgi:hypothetical protein
LKVTDERARSGTVSQRYRVRGSGSGSEPKYHGSGTPPELRKMKMTDRRPNTALIGGAGVKTTQNKILGPAGLVDFDWPVRALDCPILWSAAVQMDGGVPVLYNRAPNSCSDKLRYVAYRM